MDSDCVLPPNYIQAVRRSLKHNYTDAFGGPDAAHKNFSLLQKAINYSMTSLLTTGGIRGSTQSLKKFYPRSFNMGVSREAWDATNGFLEFYPGEDIDLSIRILKNGFQTKLIPEAFVYHKRRTTLNQFFKQVFNFGRARINLIKLHPNYFSAIHLVPSFFIIGIIILIFFSIRLSFFFLIPIGLYALVLFIHSTIKNNNLLIGGLSILTSFIQIVAYGLGYIWGLIQYR